MKNRILKSIAAALALCTAMLTFTACSGPPSAKCWQQPSRKPPSSRNAPKKKSSKGG